MITPLFKGGNLTINSGGVGPDDYLFRKLPRGPWTRIIIRHGPRDRVQYEADRAGLTYLIKNSERTVHGDNVRFFAERKKTRIETLPAATFAARHGGPPEPEYPLVLDDSLVDAWKKANDHPMTFARPSNDTLRILRPGDSVKICRNNEGFWVLLTDVHGRWLEGTVDNDLLLNPDLPDGRAVCFEWRHVYDVLREEK